MILYYVNNGYGVICVIGDYINPITSGPSDSYMMLPRAYSEVD